MPCRGHTRLPFPAPVTCLHFYRASDGTFPLFSFSARRLESNFGNSRSRALGLSNFKKQALVRFEPMTSTSINTRLSIGPPGTPATLTRKNQLLGHNTQQHRTPNKKHKYLARLGFLSGGARVPHYFQLTAFGFHTSIILYFVCYCKHKISSLAAFISAYFLQGRPVLYFNNMATRSSQRRCCIRSEDESLVKELGRRRALAMGDR